MFKLISLALSAILLAAIGSMTPKPKAGGPAIASISPISGYIGTTVTLTGTGFSTDKNTVYVSQQQSIWGGASLDGRTLVFTIPNTIGGKCYPGSPCRLWVENESGKSNTVDFSLAGWILPEVQVNVTSPNGGVMRQGEGNLISWTGGHRVVALGLAKEGATTDFDIASTGMIVGWINTNEGQGYHLPNSSFLWDGKQVCDLNLNPEPDTNCHFVVPGSYKIIVWSEDPSGSMWIGTGLGKDGRYPDRIFRGNWSLSPVVTVTK